MVDSHIHVNVDKKVCPNNFFFGVDDIIAEMDKNGIEKAVVMLNPAINTILCKNNEYHRVRIDLGDNNNVIIRCANCNALIYEGVNPYLEQNKLLLDQTKKYIERLYPIVFLLPLQKLLDQEVDYYEHNFDGQFYGYKIHPSFSCQSIDNLKVNSNKMILFHSGNNDFDSPDKIVKFADNYKSNVVIAHFAKFDFEVFEQINQRDNIFIDTSPISIMFNAIKETPEKLFCGERLDYIESAQKLMPEIIKYVNPNKIIYGSDAPVSSMSLEKAIYEQTELPMVLKKQISCENIFKAMGR
ncbi:MAG: hypothetical protein PHY08_11690 [Candidatus Cloacimonetes bacterium]|nr:hypothetical protein [Candidatus Cloacimonadota bacterium]